MISSFSACEFGPLSYRQLEMNKIQALSKSRGNFDAKMSITSSMHQVLDWWISNIQTAIRQISYGSPSKIITTDASKTG